MYKLMERFRKARNKKGFTLIELIVVIVIIGILAAIIIPRFAGVRGNANEKAAMATVANIQKAAEVAAVEENILLGDVTNAQIYAVLGITDFDTDYDGNPAGADYAWSPTAGSDVGLAGVSGITVPGDLGAAFDYGDM